MSEAAGGASRRDLLRGSAIGVGALVGAMTLTSSNEEAAGAAGVTRDYYATFTGINPSTKVKVTSVSFGGDDNGGVLTPDIVSLTLPSSRYSPLILKKFVEKTTTTATITGYQPDAVGKLVNFVTITCTGALITHYHLSVSSAGAPSDNLHLVFASIDLKWVLNNVHYTWSPTA